MRWPGRPAAGRALATTGPGPDAAVVGAAVAGGAMERGATVGAGAGGAGVDAREAEDRWPGPAAAPAEDPAPARVASDAWGERPMTTSRPITATTAAAAAALIHRRRLSHAHRRRPGEAAGAAPAGTATPGAVGGPSTPGAVGGPCTPGGVHGVVAAPVAAIGARQATQPVEGVLVPGYGAGFGGSTAPPAPTGGRHHPPQEQDHEKHGYLCYP